jgi:hypothetical protein
MDPAFAGTRGFAPNQNIENNPMQSNKVPRHGCFTRETI